MNPQRGAVALVALAQLAIGAAAIFARFALVTGGPLGVSWARMAIAALVMLVISGRRRAFRLIDLRSERSLVVAGALLALHFAAWIASLKFASVAISTLLVCSTPVWTEAYSVIRRKRVDPYAALSIAGALAGVAIVVGAPDRANTPLGIALALIGSVAIAAYLIIVRGVDERYDTLAITTRTYAYAALALGFAMSWSGPAGALPSDWRGWAGIVAMALVSQLFGHTAINAAVRVLSATLVSTFTLLEPVMAGLLAAVIFHERLGPATAIGATVILAAIAVALRGEARGAAN
jgi:drug/metabolite transporter (DMT)-like permease